MATSSNVLNGQFALRRILSRNFRVGVAFLVLLVLIIINVVLNPNFFTAPVITSNSNQAITLVFAGIAQTSVVITGGIDLSVGPIISLSNSLASSLFTDSVPAVIGVVILVLLAGMLCGLINGLIVVYGRLQPIIVTIATASVYSGVALLLRPRPGGFVPDWYGDLLTKRVFNVIPASLVFLLIVLVVIWIPFRRSRLGLWVYAIGSNESAAYMSGVNVNRAKLAAYVMGGLFAAIGGLFLSASTLSGNASTGAVYTLQSIAVVVLGGTSLFGGAGGVIGTIAGAFSLRLIQGILFFSKVNPLQQPLWEGIVILIAVAAGASRIFTVKNRLDIMR
ncbi:MAG: ABC transporter permease [Anaerolineae bacterium]|nr:ABC transporter permease [Anaerolineae bacterium]